MPPRHHQAPLRAGPSWLANGNYWLQFDFLQVIQVVKVSKKSYYFHWFLLCKSWGYGHVQTRQIILKSWLAFRFRSMNSCKATNYPAGQWLFKVKYNHEYYSFDNLFIHTVFKMSFDSPPKTRAPSKVRFDQSNSGTHSSFTRWQIFSVEKYKTVIKLGMQLFPYGPFQTPWKVLFSHKIMNYVCSSYCFHRPHCLQCLYFKLQ